MTGSEPAKPIADYGIIGNANTAALVARDGSIDWLCMPRFDSEAVFAAILGTNANGRWLLAPRETYQTTRRYRGNTAILETRFETDSGIVTVIDFMAPVDRDGQIDLIRIVRGDRGRVDMMTEIIFRFDYGRIVPWVRRRFGGTTAAAGPDSLFVTTAVELVGEDMVTRGRFTVAAGEQVPFVISWYPSHRHAVILRDPLDQLLTTENWWQDWAYRCTAEGPWRDAVMRSLITLKTLTFGPTGGIIAAATTSLPERLGGVRNWDYRYCWIRDATFTLYALLTSGFREEARAWREWLLRAVAGAPSELQIMYGVAGERRLTEFELPWLPGYAGSKPVRVGNAAHEQFQLDVYGELMDVLHACRRFDLGGSDDDWNFQRTLMGWLEGAWQQPDDGIWEIRGPRRYFTHSRVMAWVAFDRAVKSIEQFECRGPLERWRSIRDQIHAEVLARGYDAERGCFVQYYGGKGLDAALLLIPQVGFLPCDDPRVIGTIEAIQRELMVDGLVQRYSTSEAVDGLPPGEGAFLACSFWLADALAMLGRIEEAQGLFEYLLALCNDLGLMAEEYEPQAQRMLGNFPQAFSHVGLINTAHNLMSALSPATHRAEA